MRLGLCCQFYNHPIKYKTATVKVASKKENQYLTAIYKHNIEALKDSLKYCYLHGIRAFRVSSDLFPLATHGAFEFNISDYVSDLADVRAYAEGHNIVLSLHPDQFVVLNSPKPEVVANSIKELTHQVKVASLIGAEQVTLHAGGVYADKKVSMERLVEVVNKLLPSYIKQYLCFENDDKSYSPKDIVSICKRTNCRFIYDVHHHRFNPDDLTIEAATCECMKHWFRITTNDIKGWVHLSSPKNGTSAHDDYINIYDFPMYWADKNLVIDVEAKAKEEAVLTLGRRLSDPTLPV